MTKGYDNFGPNMGLVLDLKMDEGDDVIAHDFAKPNHLNPTLTGTPTWAQLDNGKNYLDFDSANPDFIEIAEANSNDLDFLTADDFSIACWVNIDSLNDRSLVDRGYPNAGDGGYYFFIASTGRVTFTTFNGVASAITQTAISLISAGNWYHIVVTRSSGFATIYVNGVDMTSISGDHSTITTSNRKFLVGVYYDEASYPFDGKMGEVKVWNREISVKEVKQLYELTRRNYE